MVHQKYVDYKAIKMVDDSQKRFIFQGSFVPESERIPAALYNLFNLSLKNSGNKEKYHGNDDEGKLKPSRTSVDSAKPSNPTNTIVSKFSMSYFLLDLKAHFFECHSISFMTLLENDCIIIDLHYRNFFGICFLFAIQC